MAASATSRTVRRWVMTAGVTAITVTGALYGAGLKSQQEFKQEKSKIIEATSEEKIAQLQVARQELVTKRNELQRKITEVSSRRKAKELQDIANKG